MTDEAEGYDYRGNYKAAVEEALKGGIGVYADFDQQRMSESFRMLCGDRARLITFASREGISTGHIETLQTLKSPKPLYQIIAVNDEDTKRVRTYLERIKG